MHSGGRGLLSKARDAEHRSSTAWAVASRPVTPRCDSLGHQRGQSPPEAGGPDALLGVREVRALRHGKEAALRRSGERGQHEPASTQPGKRFQSDLGTTWGRHGAAADGGGGGPGPPLCSRDRGSTARL